MIEKDEYSMSFDASKKKDVTHNSSINGELTITEQSAQLKARPTVIASADTSPLLLLA